MDRMCKIIAILEIVGGVSGLCFTAWLIVARDLPASAFFVMVPFVVMFLVAIFAGMALWAGRAVGRWLSIGLQVLQLPNISSTFFDYEFVLGLSLTPGLFGGRFGLDIEWLSEFAFYRYGGREEPVGLGLNVVALFCLVHLARHLSSLLNRPSPLVLDV